MYYVSSLILIVPTMHDAINIKVRPTFQAAVVAVMVSAFLASNAALVVMLMMGTLCFPLTVGVACAAHY